MSCSLSLGLENIAEDILSFTHSGHSAVRLCVLETLVRFLKEEITPLVPLRGSISASGDLSPVRSGFSQSLCHH